MFLIKLEDKLIKAKESLEKGTESHIKVWGHLQDLHHMLRKEIMRNLICLIVLSLLTGCVSRKTYKKDMAMVNSNFEFITNALIGGGLIEPKTPLDGQSN